MFLKEGDDDVARWEALLSAVDRARQADMWAVDADLLRQLIPGRFFTSFCRALTREPAALVEPMRVTLKAGADLLRVKGKPRL